MPRPLTVACVLSLLLAVGAPHRAAAKRRDLRRIDKVTLAGLAPILEDGDIALTESHENGLLKQGTILAIADAPAKVVLAIVADPAGYPKFVPNLVRMEITQRVGNIADVDWELEVPFVNLKGKNRMHDDRPTGVRYWSVEGSIKDGNWYWQAVDIPGGRSVVAYYTYSNIRKASWFLKKLIDMRPTMEHGAVVSTGFVLLKAVCNEAGRRAGRRAQARPSRKRRKPIKITSLAKRLDGPVGRAIMPLIRRGEVAIVQSEPDGHLKQAVVMNLMDVPPERVHKVVADPALYPEFMPSVTSVDITRRSDNRITYVQKLKIPLIELSVITEMMHLPGLRIAMRLLGGDLKNGRYAWEFLPVGGGQKTLALFYLNTDVAEHSWFLKKLVEKEPYYEHGLNFAVGLVSSRAVERRSLGLPNR